VVHDALVLLALWGLAVAQPLLDLFGKNPEFFVANDLTSTEIVLFGVVIAFAAPIVLVVADLGFRMLGEQVGTIAHSLLVGLLGTAFGLTLLGQLEVEDALLVFLIGAFVGVLVAHLEHTSRAVRTGLRYLALAPVLFLVAFLAFSPSAELLRGEDADSVEAGVVGRPAPVVIVSLDEFPLASLLRADGTINRARFPNFARLADQADWFRNATSVSHTTTESVPAMLTGRLPEPGQLPTYRDHPRSVFTLLGDAYSQHVSEQVTEVCPNLFCPDTRDRFEYERLRTSVIDAAAVYAHAAVPPTIREHLPAIDRSWGGFVTQANVTEDAGFTEALNEALGQAEDDASRTAARTGPDASCPDIELWCGPARISELIESIESTRRPGLYVTHATFPHFPWILSATGQQYAPRSFVVPGTATAGSWGSDTVLVRQSFQRHLLQVGYMDRLLGRMIDRLEDTGLWDDAMVVVLSDHGVAFRPGESLRTPAPTTMHEIYNIPFFIKFPGQREGHVRDQNALNVDVVPTIVDALDIETDWEFDGESLVEGRPHREDKPTYHRGNRGFVAGGFDRVLEVVARNQSYLPHREDWLGVAAVGTYGGLVGRPVASLDTRSTAGLTWTTGDSAALRDWDPASDQLAPLLIEGEIELAGAVTPTEALIVVNGTVAGVATGFDATEGRGASFTALIAEETLRPGSNDVSLLVPTGPGARTFSIAALTS
jgi:hypothetical protein